MTLIYILNLIASAILIAPIAVLLSTRLRFKKSYPILFIYLIITLVYSLMTLELIKVSHQVIKYNGVINNLLDGPLMLGFMTVLAYNRREKLLMKKMAAGLLIFSAIVLMFSGFTITTIRIVLGPTVIICLVQSCRYFIWHSKTNLRKTGGTTGKGIIAASLVIAYAAYLLIYLLFYVLHKNPAEDAFIVYYLATTVAAGCLTAGLYKEAGRLRKIDEVQVVRKELAVLYAEDPNNPRPRRPRTLDELLSFDISEIIAGIRQ